MKRKDVERYEKVIVQLESIYSELSNLSKKTPNGPVNKFKLNFINETLVVMNYFLSKEYAPFKDFAKFDTDELPSNSDVTFIISQYLQCAEIFRVDHITNIGYGHWAWVTDDIDFDDDTENIAQTALRAHPPKSPRD